MTIKIYNKWGHERSAGDADNFDDSTDANPHGMTPEQIEAFSRRVEAMAPGAVANLKYNRNALQDLLPEGRTLDPRRPRRTANFGHGHPGVGGHAPQTFHTTQRQYNPEMEWDRQCFPIHRRQANQYWRLFYKMDPTIGAVIDLLAELPWSDFQLTGEGVEGEIKELYEQCLTETKIRSLLPYFIREFFVVGEVCPHAFFDNEQGIWTHLALHNPDQLNVVNSPFIKMNTLIEFVPDSKLKEIVNSNHPMLQRVRETMPPDLVSALRAGKNIPLSPVNATFIARKQHPYDVRGTSIISRLWRTMLGEDSLWSAFIQIARRAAHPIRVAKVGDPATGTIPGPEVEAQILSLLTQAENDPAAWLCVNHQISFEMVGDPGRLMSINTHYELFERMKLTALGVSKSFLTGEASYSSAAAGLTIFLQRLKALREFFVNEWLIPKFLLPLAVMNEWIKPDKAQSAGGQLRVKRSFVELRDQHRYIVPTIEWEKKLDPNIDKERIDAMIALEQQLGIKISDQRKYSAMNLNNEEEQQKIILEAKRKIDLAGDDPRMQAAIGLLPPAGAEGGAGGGMGGSMMPGIPPEAMGLGGDELGSDMGDGGAPASDIPITPDEGVAPEGGGSNRGVAVDGDKGSKAGPVTNNDNDTRGYESTHWSKDAVNELCALFDTYDPKVLDSEPWTNALRDRLVAEAIKTQDPTELWMAVESWLIDENYPSTAIQDLQRTLAAQGSIGHHFSASENHDAAVATYLPDIADNPADTDFFVGAKNGVHTPRN